MYIVETGIMGVLPDTRWADVEAVIPDFTEGIREETTVEKPPAEEIKLVCDFAVQCERGAETHRRKVRFIQKKHDKLRAKRAAQTVDDPTGGGGNVIATSAAAIRQFCPIIPPSTRGHERPEERKETHILISDLSQGETGSTEQIPNTLSSASASTLQTEANAVMSKWARKRMRKRMARILEDQYAAGKPKAESPEQMLSKKKRKLKSKTSRAQKAVDQSAVGSAAPISIETAAPISATDGSTAKSDLTTKAKRKGKKPLKKKKTETEPSDPRRDHEPMNYAEYDYNGLPEEDSLLAAFPPPVAYPASTAFPYNSAYPTSSALFPNSWPSMSEPIADVAYDPSYYSRVDENYSDYYREQIPRDFSPRPNYGLDRGRERDGRSREDLSSRDISSRRGRDDFERSRHCDFSLGYNLSERLAPSPFSHDPTIPDRPDTGQPEDESASRRLNIRPDSNEAMLTAIQTLQREFEEFKKNANVTTST